jgi:hypothetical protein
MGAFRQVNWVNKAILAKMSRMNRTNSAIYTTPFAQAVPVICGRNP